MKIRYSLFSIISEILELLYWFLFFFCSSPPFLQKDDPIIPSNISYHSSSAIISAVCVSLIFNFLWVLVQHIPCVIHCRFGKFNQPGNVTVYNKSNILLAHSISSKYHIYVIYMMHVQLIVVLENA